MSSNRESLGRDSTSITKRRANSGCATKFVMVGAVFLASVYGLYLMNFILHKQQISAVFNSLPEHRGAGQRAEWGMKNRGAPAGILPHRPGLKERKQETEEKKAQIQVQRNSGIGVSNDAASQLLRKAKHAGDIVKPVGHRFADHIKLAGEPGGPDPPDVPFVNFQYGKKIVHGRAGMLEGFDSQHLHGILGVGVDGKPLWQPMPDLDWSKETLEEKRRRHTNTGFNLRRSDSIVLDRELSDKRHVECKSLVYDYHNLPKTSVVMVFYNEPLSPLYRSVVSVLDRTPPELLHVSVSQCVMETRVDIE